MITKKWTGYGVSFQSLGAISLAGAVVLDRFLKGTEITDFLCGFLLGLSIVLNVAGIFLTADSRKGLA